MEHCGDYIASVLHVEELLEGRGKEFLATISMVNYDGQHEMHDIGVVA